MAYYQYFSECYQELIKEVYEHPELVEKLLDIPVAADFSERLGVIAAHCNILLDDYYTPTDIENITTLCIRKLQEKRTQIILPL